jgi:very-short-patch-repair endonuclease
MGLTINITTFRTANAPLILKAYGAYVLRFRNEMVDQDVSGAVSRIMGVLANR